MKWHLIFLLLLLPSLACGQSDVKLGNMPPDGWGGKNSHLTYSAGMGLVGTQLWPKHPVLVGLGCFAVGVYKEYRDMKKGQLGYRHGLFSRNDLKMDGLGCLIGTGTGAFLVTRRDGTVQAGYSWELK